MKVVYCVAPIRDDAEFCVCEIAPTPGVVVFNRAVVTGHVAGAMPLDMTGFIYRSIEDAIVALKRMPADTRSRNTIWSIRIAEPRRLNLSQSFFDSIKIPGVGR